MNLRYVRRSALALTALAAIAACDAESTLSVENTNNPDVERAFATADGIQAIISNGVSQMLGAVNPCCGLMPAAMVMSFESYGSVANFGMNLRATIPRAPIDNNRGNATQAENHRDFLQQSLRGRTVANAVAALDRFTKGGGSLGNEGLTLRARSFGFFSIAIANGQMALMYDSVAVARPALESTEVPPLQGYKDAMGVALAQLDSAIASL